MKEDNLNKSFFQKTCYKIKSALCRARDSFLLASKGKEDLQIVLWGWGVAAYVASFFINKFILFVNLPIASWVISMLVIAYFIWHIVALKRCTPKKIPLTKEEKIQLKKDRLKRISNKLLLREPISKWNPSYAEIAFDLYLIVCFAEYLM
ncbi:MAG: hypothetical protein ACJA0S_000047 [Rickettsiales bacterium]|jgi:hypothetical protein